MIILSFGGAGYSYRIPITTDCSNNRPDYTYGRYIGKKRSLRNWSPAFAIEICSDEFSLKHALEGATRSNRCVVCSEKQSKRVNPAAKHKDRPKCARTVYWYKSCEMLSLLAMKTVSNYITRKYSFGTRLVNA